MRDDDAITLIRPRALARELGISPATLWRSRRRGEIPAPIRMSSGVVAWRVRDIAAWIETRREEADQ